ncbi:MAG TPA: histidine kinase, partial [Bacteroidota bacterium]|nr:histidine kinase [Bacteroidota bacterium]
WYIWGIFFPFIAWLGRRYPLGRGPWGANLARHIPALILIPVIHVFVYMTFLYLCGGLERPLWVEIRYILGMGLFFRYLTYCFLLAIVYVGDYYRQAKEREVHSSQLETRLAETQLQVLKSQLQPHFLFNTLHAISSLMHKDVEAADEIISRLGDLLRVTLETNGAQEVSLKQELDALQNYIAIEKIRLGERLTITLSVPAEAYDALVPNLVLQPIVENAVIHGVSKRSAPGHIEVEAALDKDHLRIAVSDDGPGLPAGYSEGVGLSNTRARLAQLYGSDQSITLRPGLTGGVIVTLTIPLRIDSNDPPTFARARTSENPRADR